MSRMKLVWRKIVVSIGAIGLVGVIAFAMVRLFVSREREQEAVGQDGRSQARLEISGRNASQWKTWNGLIDGDEGIEDEAPPVAAEWDHRVDCDCIWCKLHPIEWKNAVPEARIYKAETRIRNDLLKVCREKGAKRAFEKALEWLQSSDESRTARLRRLVAIRAVVGLGIASASEQELRTAHDHIFDILQSSTTSDAERLEAFKALASRSPCYAGRSAETLATDEGISFEDECWLRPGPPYPRTECPKDVLVDGPLYSKMAATAQDLDVLRGIIDRAQNFYGQALLVMTIADPKALPGLTDSLFATFAKEDDTSIDPRWTDSRATEVMGIFFEYLRQPEHIVFQEVMRQGSTNASPRVRAAIIDQLGFQYHGNPDLQEHLERLAHENVELLAHDGSVDPYGAALLAAVIVDRLSREWGGWSFPDVDAVSVHASEAERFNPLCIRAAEAMLDLPGTVPFNSWLRLVGVDRSLGDLPATFEVGDIEYGVPPSSGFSEQFVQLLERRSDSPRAAALLQAVRMSRDEKAAMGW